MSQFKISKIKNLLKFYHVDSKVIIEQKCLHETCPTCKGTGVNKITGGACVHFISCPCKKCRPFSL